MSIPSELCCANNSQLVVIDIQERLGAAMPDKVLRRVIQHTRLLLKCASLMDIPVLSTAQYPQGLGGFHPDISSCLPDTDKTLEKTSFSCCGSTGFNQAIEANDREQIILAGMESHVCVLQTAMDLHARGKQVFVINDAICSRKLDNYHNALERMQQAGIIIASTESVIFEWVRDAAHAQFKAVSALLR